DLELAVTGIQRWRPELDAAGSADQPGLPGSIPEAGFSYFQSNGIQHLPAVDRRRFQRSVSRTGVQRAMGGRNQRRRGADRRLLLERASAPGNGGGSVR